MTPAFEDIDPRTLATINKHADAVAANLVSGPEVLRVGIVGAAAAELGRRLRIFRMDSCTVIMDFLTVRG